METIFLFDTFMSTKLVIVVTFETHNIVSRFVQSNVAINERHDENDDDDNDPTNK